MFRHRLVLVLLFGTVLVLGFTVPTSADHANCIAGTYWMEVAPEGLPSLPGLLTLNADGVVLASQYLSPFTNNGRGSWEKHKRRGAKGRFLAFNYAPDGTPTTIVEVTFEGEFDRSCEEGEMTFVIAWYSADQNPLDEEPMFGQNTGFFFLRRIPAD